MKRIWIVGGTTEARLLAEQLIDTAYTVFISVATDYGIQPLSHILSHNNINVLCERLNAHDMISFINTQKPDIVIDASHPHALLVTEQLKLACEQTSTPYVNLERELAFSADVTVCASIDDAIQKLNALDDMGNVFVATGAKELFKYQKLKGFKERVYARVLPTASSIEACTSLGLLGSQIFCMQGPFSNALNIELFRMTGAKYLVTKNSGDLGGVSEKLSAAKECGISVFLISAPMSHDTKTLEQVLQIIGGHKFD